MQENDPTPYINWHSQYRDVAKRIQNELENRPSTTRFGSFKRMGVPTFENRISRNYEILPENHSMYPKDEKKKQSPTKNGKDDFDSNSYFMLRPLRREAPKIPNVMSK